MEGAGEAATVRRAQGGDAEAFRELFERHARGVHRLVVRLTGNLAAAEDVVQETFLKAWRQLPGFDGRAEFSTWLHRIAVNAAFDSLRSSGRRDRRETPWDMTDPADERPRFEPAGQDPGPQRLAESADIATALRRGLAGLTALERAAFLLRHVEGAPIRRLQDILDLDASAAKHAVFRAVRKLRRELEGFVG